MPACDGVCLRLPALGTSQRRHIWVSARKILQVTRPIIGKCSLGRHEGMNHECWGLYATLLSQWSNLAHGNLKRTMSIKGRADLDCSCELGTRDSGLWGGWAILGYICWDMLGYVGL